MKIVFIEPKPPEPHVYSKFKIPRLGCVLLATILQRAGYEVKVFVEEVSKLNWDEAYSADVIAISTTTSTTPRGYMLADRFRKAGKKIIMGGSHVSFMAEEALEHCDYVVRKEGEKVIVELIKAIEAGRVPDELPNISFKKDGKVVHNPITAFVEDLDSLPIPDYSLIDGMSPNTSVVSIETSRGCPFNCAFCSVILMFGRKLRFKSVERIVQEIKYYKNTLKPRHIFFCDDNFSANFKRTKALLRRLIEEGLDCDWSAQVRVEAARDPELLELMHKTNCYAVYVGFESVNPKTLEAYNKGQTVEEIKQAIDAFHRYKIHIHGMFIFGSDEDDIQTIYDTVDFAKKMKVDSVQFLILTPLPGTPVYNNLRQTSRIFNHDWSYYDGHNVVYEPAKMTAYELQVETFRAMNKFYTYPSVLRYILKLDAYYTLIRIYGKYMVHKGMKLKKVYIKHLQQLLSNKMKLLSDKVKHIQSPLKIGIPSLSVDQRHKEFFKDFFKHLGVSVVFSQEKEPDTTLLEKEPDKSKVLELLQRQISIIQRKVDIIFVPVLEKVNHHLSELVKAEKQIVSEIDPKLILIEIDMDTLYKSCVEVGLVLGKRLSAIRRAYTSASKKMQPLPALSG
ncbi:radical SAM protein [Candidatus Sumerlaeota bacterium]|nr:radical SAM protein [Candidatus Sumerlaeota bacterium]